MFGMEQHSADAFLSEIANFIERAGISASAFGRAAVGDPNFVGDIRDGRSPSLRLVDKARAYMRNWRPAAPMPVAAAGVAR